MKNNIIAIDVSKNYILHVDKLLERSKLEIFEWFEVPYQEIKLNTFIYKDIPSLVEGLRRRGLGPYPNYMVACMVDENPEKSIHRSINFFEPKINPENKNEYSRKEYNYVIFHELIHYITDLLYGKLPEWLTEGIAKCLDGSYKEDLTSLMTLINTYEIPDMSTMKDDTFILTTQEEQITEEGPQIIERTIYNGYDISYLMVRYIIEVYGKDYLFTLMKNKKQIPLIENQTITEAIEYYKNLYFAENTIKNPKI